LKVRADTSSRKKLAELFEQQWAEDFVTNY